MNSHRLVRAAFLSAMLGCGIAARPAQMLAQGVLVAPPGVFIDHRTRSGSLELYNPNAVPAEVTISTIYG